MSTDLDWRQRAHCVGRDPEIWFPAPSEKRKADRARQICRACPVQSECAAEADNTGSTYGIWAGKARKREQAAARDLKPCGTSAAYKRHRRNDEEPCAACLAASRIDKAERAARQGART